MIRKATRADKEAVIHILSDSFDRNPAVNDTILSDRKRTHRIRALMDYVFETGFSRNGVFVNDRLTCTAVIYDPVESGSYFGDFLQQLRLIHRSVGWKRLSYILHKDKRMRSYRPATPHLYLQMIGVDPADQGRGAGSEMLEFIWQLSVKENKPVYLETSAPKNVEIYIRKGYELYDEWKVREGYEVRFLRLQKNS
ncbi:MAG: hypothetical protein Fur0041_03660 [Bacteroidia bacterium]